ncbi:MAG: DUF4249 family protein [Bacteroidota bacterium]
MKSHSILSVLLILLAAGCVDRIYFDVGNNVPFTIVAEGHISDQPGPYRVELNSAFDLESKLARTAISAKQVVLSDNLGNREVLANIDKGVYQTNPDGIHGTVGSVYTLRIELFDGRVYESKPDTLYASGSIDSVYHSFKEEKSPNEVSVYSFDIFFNASAATKNNYNFLWKFTGTFQCDTHPELKDIVHDGAPCINGKCNFYELCSGIRNISVFNDLLRAEFVRVAPCSCCTCWYDIFNNIPMVSDGQFVRDGRFTAIKAYTLPINHWIFQHKVYVTVTQESLSRQAFAFWKGIKDQKTAANSLFQPISGKIPGNFKQISGPENPIEGLFYATSIASKTILIRREDVPNPRILPPDYPWPASCLILFPNATTEKPPFWTD